MTSHLLYTHIKNRLIRPLQKKVIFHFSKLEKKCAESSVLWAFNSGDIIYVCTAAATVNLLDVVYYSALPTITCDRFVHESWLAIADHAERAKFTQRIEINCLLQDTDPDLR